jgi:hypothetical protein
MMCKQKPHKPQTQADLLQHNGENLMMMMMKKSTEFRWLQHEWQCPGISLWL